MIPSPDIIGHHPIERKDLSSLAKDVELWRRLDVIGEQTHHRQVHKIFGAAFKMNQ